MPEEKPLKKDIDEILKRVGTKNQSMKTSMSNGRCSICGNQLTTDEWKNLIWCCSKCKPVWEKRELEKWHKYLTINIEHELARRNVPPKYIKCSFDNFNVHIGKDSQAIKIIAKAREYTKIFEGGLFMTGGCGSGKTHLAVACLREALKKRIKKSFYVKVPELLMWIRHTFDKDNTNKQNEQDFIERFSGYDFLILDDMGAEKVSEYSIQILYLLVDKRDSFLKPTMICSNLSIGGLEDTLSPRITSRIVGMGRVIKNPLSDYRMRR